MRDLEDELIFPHRRSSIVQFSNENGRAPRCRVTPARSRTFARGANAFLQADRNGLLELGVVVLGHHLVGDPDVLAVADLPAGGGGVLAHGERVGEVEGGLALVLRVVEDGAQKSALLEGLEGRSGGVDADDREVLVAGEVAFLAEGFDGAEGHVVVVAEHDFDLVAELGVERLHLLDGLRAIPVGGVFGELVDGDAGGGDRLDGELGAELGVLVSRLALEHDVLDLAVAVLVGLGIGLPVIDDDLALHGTGLLGLGADVVDLVPLAHILGQRLAVEEDDRGLAGHGLVDDGRGGRAVDGVDGDDLHLLGEERVHLIVLGGLGVLGIDHLHDGLVRGVRLDGVAHVGHEGIVELIDRDADLRLAAAGGAAAGHEQGGHDRDGCHESDSFIHFFSSSMERSERSAPSFHATTYPGSPKQEGFSFCWSLTLFARTDAQG